MRWTKLRLARRERAVSQAALAKSAGMSRATVARIEAGAEGAFPGTIQKLAAALGVRPVDLLDDEPVTLVGRLPDLSDEVRQHRDSEYRRGYQQGWGAAIDSLVRLVHEDGMGLSEAYEACTAHRFDGLQLWKRFVHPTADYLPPPVPRPMRRGPVRKTRPSQPRTGRARPSSNSGPDE